MAGFNNTSFDETIVPFITRVCACVGLGSGFGKQKGGVGVMGRAVVHPFCFVPAE